MVVPRGTTTPVLLKWFVSRDVPTGNSYAPRTEQKVEFWASRIPSSSNPEKKVSEFSPKKVWQKVCPYRRGLDAGSDVEGGLGGAGLVLVVLDVRREVTGEEVGSQAGFEGGHKLHHEFPTVDCGLA
ncbi:hypothetical protein RJ640_027920 [Escallonia rubra]|uniref:Uncharacterized protein n=1 Tax=Escallonia rubra TaxID=112253 RepID=A0AA88RLX8_9ASTE|nr:hypothetical protein RJ640_027920 [Escallonia rubra]